MIYTSNYARQGSNPLAISVSRSVPKWFNGPRLSPLAPTWDMIKASKDGILSHEDYREQYIALLEERAVDPELFNEFPDGGMLLCYESPGDFCHRRILAEWVKSKIGLIIPEWKNEKEVQEGKQQELVDSVLKF